MEKYGNMVAFTNLKEIENWILEQKEYVKNDYINRKLEKGIKV